jgi:DNA gyrase subunit A
VILATKKGFAARFDEKDVRPTGRATFGVRGVRLTKGDEVVSMAVVGAKDQLLSVTENGYGKRSLVEDYRKIHRGGKGVITIKTGGRNGDVMTVREVTDDDELIVTSVRGMVIRMPVKGISLQGRATMGVRLMRLKENDRLTAVARLVGATQEERALEEGRTRTTCPVENGENVDENGAGKEDEDSDGEEAGDEEQ